MIKINNKSGFTLIEIIVVLIIIGVLASIALPNLFSNIPRSKASTALASADAYKTVLESCYGQNTGVAGGAAPCDLATLNLNANIQGITIALAGAGTSGLGTLTYTLKGTDASATLAWTNNKSYKWCVYLRS